MSECLVPGAPGVVCCGVGVGSASPLVRVSPLAGFRPVLALIWPVFGENPANAGAGRLQRWSLLAVADHSRSLSRCLAGIGAR